MDCNTVLICVPFPSAIISNPLSAYNAQAEKMSMRKNQTAAIFLCLSDSAADLLSSQTKI